MLRVSDHRRCLVHADGRPFFWLGDTAWELFHRLTREEADRYLRDRAAKGFNVIQAVALAELDGLRTPNAYGHLPLENEDPTRPVEAYFAHVDWVVDRAASLGMRIGLLPTWGDKVNRKWGAGPEVLNPDNARVYGRWLGERYRDKPLVWINGGDRPIENDHHALTFRALAEGLREGDGGRHLITFHPMGGNSSSAWCHHEAWLDFNMFQSGHGAKHADCAAMTARDWALTPTKPTLDGEPNYENHPVNWKPELGWFDQWDVRRACYAGVFAGGCGVTYGCQDIWQFYQPGRDPIGHARTPWWESLAQPASSQMIHLKRLMLARPYLTRVPDAELVPSGGGEPGARITATRDSEGSFAMIYSGAGGPFTVDPARLDAARLTAWWYSPRDGAAIWAGSHDRGGPREYTPPSSGEGQDWVLVLDDAAAGRPAPGME